jgi:hypothetical protein
MPINRGVGMKVFKRYKHDRLSDLPTNYEAAKRKPSFTVNDVGWSQVFTGIMGYEAHNITTDQRNMWRHAV